MTDKRDYREETFLNAAEFSLLRELAGFYGLSKSAMLRLCLHQVGDEFMRKQRLNDTAEKAEVCR